MQRYYSEITVIYIVHKKISLSTRCCSDQVIQWANKVEQVTEIADRRIFRLYGLYLQKDYNEENVRLNQKGYRKNIPNPNKKLNYSIEVSHSVVISKDLHDANYDVL